MGDLPGPRSQESASGEWRVNSGVHEIKVEAPTSGLIKWAAIVISVVSIAAAGLMGYGSLQTRVDRIEKDIESIKADVKSKAGTASLDKVDRRLESIESDVKDILKRLPTRRGR